VPKTIIIHFKFLLDVKSQKLLKLADVSQSYSKIKVAPVYGPRCVTCRSLRFRTCDRTAERVVISQSTMLFVVTENVVLATVETHIAL